MPGSRDQVLAWLESTSSPPLPSDNRSNRPDSKRKNRTSRLTPVTTDASSLSLGASRKRVGEDMDPMAAELPTPKRKRHAAADDTSTSADNEETPRPRRIHNRIEALSASASSSSASPQSRISRSPSKASGTSSPRKKLAQMDLGPDGVDTRVPLEGSGVPALLAQAFSDMGQTSSGEGVISRSVQESLNNIPTIKDWHFASPDVRDAFGPTPSLDFAKRVVANAGHCDSSYQAEHGWNCAVHYPLLEHALGINRVENQPLVDLTSCTSARIIKEYLPSLTPSKMVDFCLIISPRNVHLNNKYGSPTAAAAYSDVLPASTAAAANDQITALRNVLPCGSINHVDFSPLLRDPICVSIETKRAGQGTGSDEARLQIGTWMAAQWKHLAGLVEDAGGQLSTLPFLPAIIIDGHVWSFGATTREGRQTILWSHSPFGSTQTVLGVYSIVHGIQYLARWSREVFLPWYLKNVLEVERGGLNTQE